MNTFRKGAILLAAVLAFGSAQAQTMSKAEVKAARDKVSAQYAADKDACKSLAGNNRDICMEHAKGREKVSRAELDYASSGKPDDQTKVATARAEAAYAVAKEKCDDFAGNRKDVCLKEAKADETKALADAKMSKKIGEARKDDAQARMDADYKVAVEKCDALAGDARAGCLASAKAKFGKS